MARRLVKANSSACPHTSVHKRTLANMVIDTLENWEDQTSQNTLWAEQVLETKRSHKAQSISSTIEKKAVR